MQDFWPKKTKNWASDTFKKNISEQSLPLVDEAGHFTSCESRLVLLKDLQGDEDSAGGALVIAGDGTSLGPERGTMTKAVVQHFFFAINTMLCLLDEHSAWLEDVAVKGIW